MKILPIVLILGSLLVGSIPFLTDKPLLEGGYEELKIGTKEMITRVYGDSEIEGTPQPPVEPILNESIEKEERIIKDDITDCLNGKCSATLGKVRFAPYQEEWYELEKAPSLKESSRIKCVVDSDGKHLANCLDFNYTYRLIDVSIKDVSLINKDIPIKVLKVNQSYIDKQIEEKKEIDEKEMYSVVSETVYNFKDTKEIKEEWIKTDFNDIIEIGGNSTTIQLQDADTENLDDTFVSSLSATTNYGTGIELKTKYVSYDIRETYIKFNISKVIGMIIEDAKLVFTRSGTSGSIMANYTICKTYNNWSEESLIWNNKESYFDCITPLQFNMIAVPTTLIYDVTPITYNNQVNSSYVSRAITTSAENEIRYFSKEWGTVAVRPYLNITYTPPDTSPPTFSATTDNSSTDTTNSTDVQINNTMEDETGINYYTYSHNDTDGFTWTNETLINANGATSVKYIVNHSIKWFPTTGGTLGVRFWANDTGGYSNVSDIHTITVQELITDSCSCPSPPADWFIINGDECELDDECNIVPYKFRVNDGAMRISSTGSLRAGGCYVEDGESLYVEDGGGLYCEA